MSTEPKITRERIADLAPPALDNYRSSRYRADDQAIELGMLATPDRTLVLWMYELLRELEGIVGGEHPVMEPAPLFAFLDRHPISETVHRIRELGSASTIEPRLAEALHDIRGGSLTVLFAQLSRIGRVPWKSELGRSLFIATRDHMKMMRNVTTDLDPVARGRDLVFRRHSLDDLAVAFRSFTAQHGEEQVVVDVDCPDDAIIAESCVEFGAVDRVAYNLLNNAVRHTARPVVTAWLLRFAKDLRVVVANAVAPDHRALLAERLETDGSSLFGDFTTTGSGYGLRIVSELVAHAYGIPSARKLTDGGYVGARIVDDSFVAWFHWPLSDAP
jgi:signal transduction histidine kinase